MAKKKKKSVEEPVGRIEEEDLSTTGEDANIIGKVWDFFSSMKLGIILLLVLAVVSIVGTIYIPKDPMTGEQDFTRFYNNLFFRVLMALLALNLLVCSLNRFKHIVNTLKGPKPQFSEAFLKNLKTSDVFQLKENAGTAAGRVQDVLRRKGYRVFNSSDNGATFIASDKGSWGVLGPYLTHIGFIIMLVAIMVKFSGLVGFEGTLATVVGKTHSLREVSKLQNVSPDEYFDIRLDNFRTVYNNDDPRQGIKDWYSDVTVIDQKNNKTFPFTIEVNRPLVYNNIKFYQMSYGYYFAGKASSVSGGPQNFELMTNTDNIYAQAPGTDITFVINPDAPYNPYTKTIGVLIYKGRQQVDTKEAEVNKPLTYENASIEFNDVRDYSFFSVKRDPTVPYMGFGSALLTLAIIYSFLVRHRRLWAVVKDRDGAADVMIGGLSQKHKADFQRDFDSIVDELKGEKGGAERGLR